MLTYDVDIWNIRQRKNRSKPFELRWRVGSKPHSRSYKLLAQADDVHVHGSRLHAARVQSPDMLKQIITIHRPPSIGCQVTKNAGFALRELMHSAVPVRHLATFQIDCQRTRAERAHIHRPCG